MTREVEVLSEELHQSKNELKAANIQVMDLRHTLQEMKNQLVRKVLSPGAYRRRHGLNHAT